MRVCFLLFLFISFLAKADDLKLDDMIDADAYSIACPYVEATKELLTNELGITYLSNLKKIITNYWEAQFNRHQIILTQIANLDLDHTCAKAFELYGKNGTKYKNLLQEKSQDKIDKYLAQRKKDRENGSDKFFVDVFINIAMSTQYCKGFKIDYLKLNRAMLDHNLTAFDMGKGGRLESYSNERVKINNDYFSDSEYVKSQCKLILDTYGPQFGENGYIFAK